MKFGKIEGANGYFERKLSKHAKLIKDWYHRSEYWHQYLKFLKKNWGLFQINALANFHTAKLPHFHTAKLPHFHTVKLPHFHTAKLPQFHTAKLTHLHTANLPHLHTAKLVASAASGRNTWGSTKEVQVFYPLHCTSTMYNPKKLSAIYLWIEHFHGNRRTERIKYMTPQSTGEIPSRFCCFRAEHLRKHQRRQVFYPLYCTSTMYNPKKLSAIYLWIEHFHGNRRTERIKDMTPQSTGEIPSRFYCFRAEHLRKHQGRQVFHPLHCTSTKYNSKKSSAIYLWIEHFHGNRRTKMIKYTTPQSTGETPSSFCCFREEHLRKHQGGTCILSNLP